MNDWAGSKDTARRPRNLSHRSHLPRMTVVSPPASLRHRLAHLGALAILVGVLWCLPMEARAQMTLLQQNYDTAGNTRLEVTAVFSPEIDRGYLPVGEFAEVTVTDWRGYDLVAN